MNRDTGTNYDNLDTFLSLTLHYCCSLPVVAVAVSDSDSDSDSGSAVDLKHRDP